MSFSDVKVINDKNIVLNVTVVASFTREYVDENYKTLLDLAKEKLDILDNFIYRNIFQDLEKYKKETWFWNFKYPDLSIYNNKEVILEKVNKIASTFQEYPISEDMYIAFDMDDESYMFVYDKETKKFDKLVNSSEYEELINGKKDNE